METFKWILNEYIVRVKHSKSLLKQCNQCFNYLMDFLNEFLWIENDICMGFFFIKYVHINIIQYLLNYFFFNLWITFLKKKLNNQSNVATLFWLVNPLLLNIAQKSWQWFFLPWIHPCIFNLKTVGTIEL